MCAARTAPEFPQRNRGVTSQSPQYEPCAVLHGYQDAVNALSICPSGQYLAAVGKCARSHDARMPIHNVHAVTGYAGALVWDISPVPQEGAALPVPTPFQPSGPSSTMTTCLWVAFVAAKRDLLVIGNVQGDIIVWSIERKNVKV